RVAATPYVTVPGGRRRSSRRADETGAGCRRPRTRGVAEMNEDLGSGQDRIVVGVDGSEPSKSALRWAARMSAMTGAPIDAVIAWQPPPNYGWGYMNAPWRPDVDADMVLHAAVDSVFGPVRPSGMRLIIERGT